MAKEKPIEVESKEEPKPQETAPAKPVTEHKPAGEAFKEVFKQMGDILQTTGGAISTRDNVVMVRVNGETLTRLDMLVSAEICKSRSEAAAYLINEGIKANSTMYSKIGEVTEQIAKLKAQLYSDIQTEIKKEK